MITGEWKAATILNNGTSSAAVDLGREYEFMLIQLPALTSNTIKPQVAETLAGTYYDIYDTPPASGAAVKIISAATTGEYMWLVPIGGSRYIKIVSGGAQGAERLIRVRGQRA